MDDFRQYAGVAEVYERVRAPMTAAVAADVVALVAPQPRARVLDIGSGTGVAAHAASSAVPDALVVAVDRSIDMLEVGRRAREGLRGIAAEAIQLPFRDATFDVALAGFVVAEFTRYETALFDVLRVLRSGGTLAGSTWANERDELSVRWRSLVEETVGLELVRSALKDATPWAALFGDPGNLEQTLRDSGLRRVRVERRSYRFGMARDDYIAEHSTRALGRFVRQMLGERGYESFLDRARSAFATAYGDRVEDTREVLIFTGTKP